MFYKIRDFIRKHFIGYRPSDMPCIDYLESKGVENMKDKEIEVYINGEKVDITDIYEPLKQGEYFYKENGKWYVHKLKSVSKIIEEDKKIKKLEHWVDVKTWVKGNDLETGLSEQSYFNKNVFYKINEIIDKLNKEE